VDFVVKEERVNAKKIEIKHAFPFPTDKAGDVLAYCTAKTRKSLKSFMKTRNHAYRSD
jgi:hypothetical protein